MKRILPLHPLVSYRISVDRNLKSEDGFTLIELIFVVMIVSILCGLAIPGYHGIIKSVIISDCFQQLSAYNKAVIGYYNTYNELPLNIGTIENNGLVSVLACPKDSPSDCASLPPVKASRRQIGGGGNFNTYWPSPSGHCAIQYRGGYGNYAQFWASPHHNSSYRDWTVSACFNAQTGASKLVKYKYELSQSYKASSTFC